MSDDLISRKATYKAFSDYLSRSSIGEISAQTELSIGEIASVIKSIPAAFDKEKVIEKLKDQYNYSRKVCNKNNNVYFEYWEGRTDSYKDAIEIVEKGGIE